MSSQDGFHMAMGIESDRRSVGRVYGSESSECAVAGANSGVGAACSLARTATEGAKVANKAVSNLVLEAAGTGGSAISKAIGNTSVDVLKHASTFVSQGVQAFYEVAKAGELGVRTSIMLGYNAMDTADVLYTTITEAGAAIDTVLDTMFIA
jgi:hypothetical protein